VKGNGWWSKNESGEVEMKEGGRRGRLGKEEWEKEKRRGLINKRSKFIIRKTSLFSPPRYLFLLI
jgi:hypothetical protein